MLRKLASTAASLPLLLLAACPADSPDPGGIETPEVSPLDGKSFVAIPRRVDSDTTAKRQQALALAHAPMKRQRAAGSTDFYLAIHKDVLDQRWFLSAFLEQYFPGAVGGGAARSLGTRVVSFEVQNDKLFVFDVDDRATTSDTFDPQRIVEAFPIVTDKAITKLPGAKNYVFIDPAAGLNRFDVMGDAFGNSYDVVKFETELSFLQNFVPLADGASWERVFTGYSDWPIHDEGVEPNIFRASGTLSFALRQYKEGEHYVEVPLPEQEHYFRSDPKLVPNSGQTVETAAHWDIYPGMQPIEWLISSELAELDETEEFADVDLVGAVAAGVTAWNDAFGFEVFTTRVAEPDESFARDDLNYIIFDDDGSYGSAFANWRTNPNTGEIRGASVYFGSNWVRRSRFPDPVEPTPDGAAPAERKRPERPKVPGLRWEGTASDPLCVMFADEQAEQLDAAGAFGDMTNAEKVEAFVGHMITHEIGHDLGLRHNFKGSLVPPSSSAMDYSNIIERVELGATVGSYDVAAVQYLYGLSADLPTEPFCTDDHIGLDPDCRTFDTGANPLDDMWQHWWIAIRGFFFDFGVGEDYELYVDEYGQEVFEYAQTGTPEQAHRALDILLEGIAAPIDPSLLDSNPNYAQAADILERRVLVHLAANASFDIFDRVEEQLARVMVNEDGIRSFRTRKQLVPILKARQNLPAYRLLSDARAVAAYELEQLTDPDQQLLAQDLIATIDAAINPYFE
jgi:hypothetical protein